VKSVLCELSSVVCLYALTSVLSQIWSPFYQPSPVGWYKGPFLRLHVQQPSFDSLDTYRAPTWGSATPGRVEKCRPHHHYHHQVVAKTMKDHLLFLLFTKSAAPRHWPPLVGALDTYEDKNGLTN